MPRFVFIVLTCLGVLIGTSGVPALRAPAAAADITPVQATAADSLVDSYGIGIHLAFLDTPYKDTSAVGNALKDLGVRHVRDDLYMTNTRQYAAIRAVAGKGIKFNLIMGRPISTESAADYVATVADKLPASAVESIEGTNEWDISGRASWVSEMKARQAELYRAAKSNPATKHLPVLAPSLAFRWNYPDAGDMSANADMANGHMYPGGWQPTTPISRFAAAIRTATGPKPIVVTEAGYNNATKTANGHLPVPESVAGTYQPRLLLDHFRQGTKRVYSYELIDEFNDPALTNVEAHFGLLRHDLSPKPAYTAMKNLLALANDPGAPFTPGSLNYRVEDGGTDLRQVLLQKRNGTFVLLLWRDVDIYDPAQRKPLAVTPDQVNLRLARTSNLTVFRPSRGSAAVSTTTAADLPLTLDGDVTAVTVSPGISGPVTPDPVTPDPVTPDPVTPDPVTPDPVTPDPVTPDPVTPDPVASSALSPPRAVKAVAGNSSATVTWAASTSGDVTGYEVRRLLGGATTRVGPTVRKVRVSGLANGGRYIFSVRALSATAVSPAVASHSVVPATVPMRPRFARAAAGRSSVALVWRPAVARGRAVTAYEVRVAGKRKVVRGHTSGVRFNRLPSKSRVRVIIRARNAAGWSAPTYRVFRTR